MQLEPRALKIIRSSKKKHQGAIFLKYESTWDKFMCKIYPANGGDAETTEIANRIIELVADFEGRKNDKCRRVDK